MEDEKEWREMFEQDLKKKKKQRQQEEKRRQAQLTTGQGSLRMAQLFNQISTNTKNKSKTAERSRQQLAISSRTTRYSSPTSSRSLDQLAALISDAHAESRQISQTQGTISLEISKLRRSVLELQSKLQLYVSNQANMCNIDAQVNKNKGAMVMVKKQLLKQMLQHQQEQQLNIERLKQQARLYDQECRQAMKSESKPKKKKKLVATEALPSVVKIQSDTPPQLSKHELKQILEIKWLLNRVCQEHASPRQPFPISKEKIRILGKMELIQAFQCTIFKLGRAFEQHLIRNYHKLIHESKQLQSLYKLRQQNLAEKRAELQSLSDYLNNQTKHGSFAEAGPEVQQSKKQKEINERIVHTGCQFLIAFIDKLMRITACIKERVGSLEDQTNINCLWQVMEQWRNSNVTAKWKHMTKQKDQSAKINLINFVTFLTRVERNKEVNIKNKQIKEVLEQCSKTIASIFQWLHDSHYIRCRTDISVKTSPFNLSYCIESPEFYCRQNHLRLIEKLENAKMRCMGTRRHLNADAELNEVPINTQRKYRINLKKIEDSKSRTSRKGNQTANQISLDEMRTQMRQNSYLFSSIQSERFYQEQKQKMNIRSTLDIVKKIGIMDRQRSKLLQPF